VRSRIDETNVKSALIRLIRRVFLLCATVVTSFLPDLPDLPVRMLDPLGSGGRGLLPLGFDSIKPHLQLLCVLGPHLEAARATERSP
jgi:hypothetical protein